MWDNMFRILLMNLGYIAGARDLLPARAAVHSPSPLSSSSPLALGIARLRRLHGRGEPDVLGDRGLQAARASPTSCAFFKESFASSLLLALVLAAYVLIVSVAFQFYGGLKSLAGPLAVALLFWVTVAVGVRQPVLLPHPVPAGPQVQKDLPKDVPRLLRQSRRSASGCSSAP